MSSPNYPGLRPLDRTLLDLEAAIRAARADGAGLETVLARVANGITGRTNGHRESVLTRALVAAAEPVLALDDDDVRAIAAAHMRAHRAALAAAQEANR